jgi:hypothetical protein
MRVKGKPDIIVIIEKKILQWHGHVKRMPEERIKRGRPRNTWMEGVQTTMTTRNLESDPWRNREEWRLVIKPERLIDLLFM